MGNMDINGIVVDANIIGSYYQQKLIESGNIYNIIEEILGKYGLAISDLIEYEWKALTGNLVFNIWFEDQIKSEKIKYVENTQNHPHIQKEIFNRFGLDRRERDIEYIEAANNTVEKYILTEDNHFYDPKKKKASSIEKERIKKQRIGALCRFMNRELNITVGLPMHCCCDLSLSTNMSDI
jgi:rRNA-processing protein FCF1